MGGPGPRPSQRLTCSLLLGQPLGLLVEAVQGPQPIPVPPVSSLDPNPEDPSEKLFGGRAQHGQERSPDRRRRWPPPSVRALLSRAAPWPLTAVGFKQAARGHTVRTGRIQTPRLARAGDGPDRPRCTSL